MIPFADLPARTQGMRLDSASGCIARTGSEVTAMIAADISFWTFLWYAFAGLVIGVLAKLFMPGKQNMNIIATILLGVVSAIIGAFLWNAIFLDQEGVAWIGGVVVAVTLLWLYSRFAPKARQSE
jgi:uncharacterized membrane protein YeaQ/YmgE (transglycosylase-associated protein family)